ncbi:MAG: chromate resistance protein ChrB domain-containing protein, partial [Paracoccaceae bacterium]
LIRRFINREARFLFVAPVDVPDVAENFGATPFDIEGVHWSHRDDRCTFDTLVSEFGLSTPALDRLAMVVRAADTDRHDLAPQAAGLLALSVGLSRQYRDDLAQLEAGMALYDALYMWARDGFDEGHDWPAGRKA